VFQKLDTIKATFQLSRILSDGKYDGERQLRRALRHISICLGADRSYLSLWDESKPNIRTVAQWQIDQLDPMPEEPITMDDFSALDAYFEQNRGMFVLQKEIIFSKNRLLGALCLESRDPIDRLSPDELKFLQGAAYLLALPLEKLGVSTGLEEMNLLEHTQSDRKSESSEVHFDAPHVLLVEDNKINQLTILKMLQRCGVVVQTADDGLCGISACQKQKFDLILMDLSMPNMDGFDTTREIVTGCMFNRKTPIVAVSANINEEVGKRCLKVGMSEFISKPLRMERLQELVRKYLSK
jgi:CheY-like chemotaxis protein